MERQTHFQKVALITFVWPHCFNEESSFPLGVAVKGSAPSLGYHLFMTLLAWFICQGLSKRDQNPQLNQPTFSSPCQRVQDECCQHCILGFSITVLDLMAIREKDGLTFFFELLLLELIPASSQPLTAALQPPAIPVLAS